MGLVYNNIGKRQQTFSVNAWWFLFGTFGGSILWHILIALQLILQVL